MNNKELTIEFLSNDFIKRRIFGTELEINFNLEDSWIKFTQNSVGSYKKFFGKVKTIDSEFYVILDNVLLSYIDNKIKIQYNGKLRTYIASKNNHELNIDENNKKLKKYEQEIKLLKAEEDLTLNKRNNIKLNILIEKIFKHKAIVNFALKESQIKWNSNEDN